MKDLANSPVERQNILNNHYAVDEIQKAANIKGIFYNDQYWVTRQQAAEFFEVDERTISRYLEKYETELTNNGYMVLRGKMLEMFKLAAKEQLGKDINVPTKSTVLGVLNFRAFLNLAMLLVESNKAGIMRNIILDITIDTINQKTGGNTKYINQRDEDFVISYFRGEHYRKEFTDALRDCVNMGNAKYAIFTNKIYRSIFKENADEYRQVLKLKMSDKVRDTMYSEILDLISMYENGFAAVLREKAQKYGRQLEPLEVDRLFTAFASHPLWEPGQEKARSKMASRDMGFREALHENLKEYINAIRPEDFERFLGEKSKSLEERLEENKDIFKRLKERQ